MFNIFTLLIDFFLLDLELENIFTGKQICIIVVVIIIIRYI